MSLIDIIHAHQARSKGEYAVELKHVAKILDDAFPTELAAVSKELAKKSGLMSKMGKIGDISRKGLVGLALSGSLMFGGTAEAANYVPVGKAANVLTQHRQLKYLTNHVAGLYTSDLTEKTRARQILYRTAIHESQRLEHRRQVISKGGKLLEEGPARSIFGVEPATAKAMVHWSQDHRRAMDLLTRTSGLSAKDLSRMSKDKMADLLMSNEKFAAAMARVKFLSVSGRIPGTLTDQASYTAKKYFVGKQENRAELQKTYKKQFIDDNAIFSRRVSAAMTKQQVTRSKIGAGPMASKNATKFLRKIIPR